MQRVIVIILILSSLLPYLEWGNRSAFLFQMEYEILFSGKHGKENLVHPAIIIPLAGQLLLLVAAVQKCPRKALVLTGIALLALLILFIFLIGILSKNAATIASAFPFLITSVWYIIRLKGQSGNRRLLKD